MQKLTLGLPTWKLIMEDYVRCRNDDAYRSAHQGEAPSVAWYDKGCVLWARWELGFTRARSVKPEYFDSARPRTKALSSGKYEKFATPEPDAPTDAPPVE